MDTLDLHLLPEPEITIFRDEAQPSACIALRTNDVKRRWGHSPTGGILDEVLVAADGMAIAIFLSRRLRGDELARMLTDILEGQPGGRMKGLGPHLSAEYIRKLIRGLDEALQALRAPVGAGA